MVTREDVKKEVDKLPASFLDEVYRLLQRLSQKKMTGDPDSLSQIVNEFSDDFMRERSQGGQQVRQFYLS